MPVTNPRGRGLRAVRKNQRCDGCGCICPKGSMMLLWQVWSGGFAHKVRFCDRCAPIAGGGACAERRPIDFEHDEFLLRDICESCDSFPVCEKVEYMREHAPGEVYFGGLDLPAEE